ncbi:MAG: flagellin [Ignavibacteria bacterium]|jgi:flagellin
MGFRVNTNTDALYAYTQLAKVNSQTTKAQLRLASGQRILSVADDTSGFNVGTALKGKVSVMEGALNNVGAAKDMLSTAEGALTSINDLLVEIEGKLSDATNPTTDRTALQDDIKALANEIQDTLKSTKFNDTQLLYSAAGAGFTFQVGESTDTLTLDFASALASGGSTMGGYGTGISAALSSFVSVEASTLASTSGATSTAALQTALSTLKSAVSTSLGKIGNLTQRLDIKEETLNVSISNAESTISRLFDADYAEEQLNATKGSIMQQAATAMLAQLNAAPQQVLNLFS